MDGMNNMSQPPMDVFTASAARGPPDGDDSKPQAK